MTALTPIHHLPVARATDLATTVRNLQPGQRVRVTWHDPQRATSGFTQGPLEAPLEKRPDALFLGNLMVRSSGGHVSDEITGVEIITRPDLDLDELGALIDDWRRAQNEFEQAPVGINGTGDRTAQENQLHEAEQDVRNYLRGVDL